MAFVNPSAIGSGNTVPMAIDGHQEPQNQQGQQQTSLVARKVSFPLPSASSAPAQAPDEVLLNVPGAGPPPATPFTSAHQSNATATNTLTEFTKRRNWPAKVIEELKDIYHILDANGRIKYVSPSMTALTGYTPETLLERFLQDLLHPDDRGLFTSELNESIATGNPLRLFYRFEKHDGTYAMFEAIGHGHIANAKFAPNPKNKSPFCQAVLMVARPYPTKNAALLDSFLEHKIENERLQRRIAELKREEEDDDDSPNFWLPSQDGKLDANPIETSMATSSTGALLHKARADSSNLPPSEGLAPLSSSSLAHENLEGVTPHSRSGLARDGMACYQGWNHTNTIEMLTGLRYAEGERRRGLTAGSRSPTLVRGSIGVPIPIDQDARGGDKTKKLKLAEEYVCTDCGTLDSPEWRKGPNGPKTLCNACGLRWAKKEKKRNASTHGIVGHAASLG